MPPTPPPDHSHQTLHSDDTEVINPHEVTNSSLHELNSDLNCLTLKKKRVPKVNERWFLKEDLPNLPALEFKHSDKHFGNDQK